MTMPNTEPDMICPKCQTKYTFEQALKLTGLICPDCNIPMTPVDNTWMTARMASAEKNGMAASPISEPLCVAELWLPSFNKSDTQVVRQFISSLSLPLALEYFGEGARRVMLARGPRSSIKFLAGQIASNWPRAYLQILDEDPVSRPMNNGNINNSQPTQYEIVLGLAEPQYLPIRVWESFKDGDPVHNLLAATLGLQDHERVWLQLLAERNTRPAWLPGIQSRLKMEGQRGFIITEGPGDNSMGTNSNLSSGESMSGVPPVSSLNLKSGTMYIVMVAAAILLVGFTLSKNWPLLIGAGIFLIIVFGLLYRLLLPTDDKWSRADLKLVRQKVVDEDTLVRTLVRVNVWSADSERAQMLLGRIINALGQYGMSGGNRFKILENVSLGGQMWPAGLATLKEDAWCWFTANELGGLWHPPLVDEEISPGLVPVRGIEMRAPDPNDVEGLYKIGYYYRPDGDRGEVKISPQGLAKSCLIVGKPGTGKTSLMEHFVLANMESPDKPMLVVLDPHGDMADRLIGAIRPEDASRVRVLDIADTEYVLSYNPLDVKATGWDVDEASQMIIDIGAALWSEYWGPRMQVPLKRGVMLIAGANAQRPAGSALGLSMLNELLTAQHEVRKKFMENELDGSQYQDILARYFNGEYKSMSNNLRDQVIQPVLSKASRFQENPLLALFSAPSSKLDLTKLIEDRCCLIINTRMSRYGKELSGFVGSMIVNLIIREVFRQGEKSTLNRIPVAFVIDEFQTFSGVAWQELIAQLRKFGGRTVLGTQSLASLRTQDRELVGQIMSGVYPLFAFAMNGEDAEYISRYEFNGEKGGPSANTLNSLDVYSAYVRMLRADGRMMPPFYFKSREPAPVDDRLRQTVLDLRKGYSALLAETYQQASQSLTYLDQYGGNLLSQGMTSTPGVSASAPTTAIARATNALRTATAGGDGTGGGASPAWTSLEDLGKDVDPTKVSESESRGPVLAKGDASSEAPTRPIDDTVADDLMSVLGNDIDEMLKLD